MLSLEDEMAGALVNGKFICCGPDCSVLTYANHFQRTIIFRDESGGRRLAGLERDFVTLVYAGQDEG